MCHIYIYIYTLRFARIEASITSNRLSPSRCFEEDYPTLPGKVAHICVYIYIYVYMHTYLHTYMHTYIHISIYIYIMYYDYYHTYIYIYIYIYTHTYKLVERISVARAQPRTSKGDIVCVIM